MTSDNSESQIGLLNLKSIKIKIQFKIRDLRLYYSTVHLSN